MERNVTIWRPTEATITERDDRPTSRLDVSPFLGTWSGSWRTWVEPGVLHDESAIAMTFVPVLGGADMLQRYEASIAGAAVEGRALIGPSQDGVTVAWADTWHTQGLVLVSRGDVTGSGISVSTPYKADGAEWTWTTDLAVDDDHLILRHYNEGPELDRYLGVEARLRRT